MTTVSASSAAALVNPPKVEPKAGAHKQRLLDQISAQAQAGSLSATDASALTSAVQDIDQAMSSASGTSGTSGARLDPAQAKSRMDDLIGAEVTKGTLTSDQATTLKSLLSSQRGGGQGGDRGGVGGAGGPPPGPPPAGAADATDATSATDAASSASDLLAGFLKQLQATQAQCQASGYGASGSTGTPKGSQAAVFDFTV
ncbi:hypothetical protein SAMN02799631_06687 [Methylobacterium sp. 174MFSha1.1]|uniref:hypothetical protein n=1 Tax=Methylobacterium sp. 174MFSha1.1 TaxID=1502749 RepID=UPI0008F0B6BC|nr:hypothetical protein [Methylobacterium sp. 174MFSha1.1]SFV17265.1 hypothetical protein SAMN02799631_06687 [Methylobacterium sp. 174MFSha1.1]